MCQPQKFLRHKTKRDLMIDYKRSPKSLSQHAKVKKI